MGPAGSPGAAGQDGEDGSVRAYGDGSAGDLELNGTTLNFFIEEDRALLMPDNNSQYQNVTIGPDTELTVPSGFVFRCTGTFTNQGAIRVLASSNGGDSVDPEAPIAAEADAGVAFSGGRAGEVVPGTVGDARSRAGGIGLSSSALLLLQPTRLGGAGGGGRLFSGGQQGGGSLWIFAAGAVRNEGFIIADSGTGFGAQTGGGGGGGVVLIASQTSVTNAPGAEILARGGDGEDGFDRPPGLNPGHSVAPSGGGGGGIVHFLAPTLSNLGRIAVDGGAAGALGTVGSNLQPLRQGGSSGGACAGNGGRGGTFLNTTPGAAEPGVEGRFIASQFDPTSLL